MGETMMGSTKHKGNISMLTDEQQKLFSQLLQNIGPDFMQSLGNQIKPMDQEQMDAQFQKTYVDPAMQQYEQRILPAIQQRFVDMGAGSSSALNQALGQSAQDLSTALGSQYGQFAQNQNMMQQNALAQYMPLVTGQTFTPLIQQRQGLAGPLAGAVGSVGQGAAMGMAMSSREVKEHIRDYSKGLDDLSEIEVRQYDYITAVGGEKNRVGVIAEELPEELTHMRDNILHVDLYGLMGLMINSIKNLNQKIEALEAR